MLYFPIDWSAIALVTRTLDDPAVAAALQWPTPENTRILIHSINLTLTTDANAANRYVTIRAYQGSTKFCEAPAPGPQVASEAIAYNFAPCVLGIDESDDQSTMWAPISEHLILDPGSMLELSFTNAQAADQISDATLRYYQAKPR